jgi:hypothetical protein
MADSCKHGNVLPVSKNDGGFAHQMREYQLVKDCAPRSQ